MRTGKLYLFEVILLLILFVALLVSNNMTLPVLAFSLFVYMLVAKRMFTKNQRKSLYSREITYILIALGLSYVGIFYLLGFVYSGFSKQAITFGLSSIFTYIIPNVIIIISSELVRYIFLSQDSGHVYRGKKIDIPKILTFINMVLIDMILVRGMYNLETLNGFLGLTGFTLFASISYNLFYNYISKRYGEEPVIAHRLIVTLYAYLIPIFPNVYIFFRSFLRMVYPFLMYLILEYGYTKDRFVVSFKQRKGNFLRIATILIATTLVIMLISCKFRYGIIVIGSGSMTGSINYGDAAVFESYHGQKVEPGQVVVFKKEGVRLIHRIVDVQNINGELRFFTKGDANDNNDEGYRTSADLMGVFKFKINYIGYPTLFVNDLFGQK